ncbi:hypothetical protein N657DRAFT_571124 [Parathielavia appendiculata]|uniref:Uncharacterized protein n=1 Tax=Parathielavia appendiculata TaxID=2587402 RepID=A0AAN6U1E8_9PEZI|nr:hypothetical protein N657DRAFT_571124 [Parathielavia appendiculata]
MCQPPAEEVVRDMLGPVVSPEDNIERIRAVPSLRPRRIYEVVLSDGRTLHLVLPSLTMWRPLRSEQDTVSSEAAAVRWIRDTVSPQQETTTTPTTTSTPQPHQPRQQHQDEQPSFPASSSPNLPPLPLLLPTLLHHGQKSHLPESSFAVYAPVPGTPLALLPSTPSRSAQSAIDYQLGAFFRTLASLTSPTGRFGPLAAVVNSNVPPTTTTTTTTTLLPKVIVEGGLSATGGAGTWSVAFHSMLEGVLRDGEDMAVVMAYSAIRRQLRRLGYVLDEVTVGRLVLVDFMLDGVEGRRRNVLVVDDGEEEDGGGKEGKGDEGKGDERKGDEVGLKTREGGDVDGEARNGKGEKVKEIQRADVQQGEEGEKAAPTETDSHPRHRLRVTGLCDWSSCVFGDPLLAAVFSDPQQQQPPSSAFLGGFSGEKQREPNPDYHHRRPLDPHHHLPFPLNEIVIEATDTAWIRILLYQVYHAATHIVGEFYRPRQDSSARELEARRKLNEALARLAEVPDDAKRKHQRPSGEMSPAKRQRGPEERC